MEQEKRQVIAQYMLDSRWEEASVLLLEELSTASENVENLGVLAEIYRYAGKFDDSVSLFQKAIYIAETTNLPTEEFGLASSLSNMYENIALSQFALGDNEDALKSIDTAISINNQNEYAMAQAIVIANKLSGINQLANRAEQYREILNKLIEENKNFQRSFDINREIARAYLQEIMKNANSENLQLPTNSFDALDQFKKSCFIAIANLRNIPEEQYRENDIQLLKLADEFLRQLCLAYYVGTGTNESPSYYEKDYTGASKGFQCWKLSAETGNTDAYHFLGMSYYSGSGTEQDYPKAFEWLRKAEESHPGDKGNQAMLAICYFYGFGTEKNPDKAFEFVQQPAIAGNATAQRLLGEMYENGAGVEQNNGKALEWYQKSFASDADEKTLDAINMIKAKMHFGDFDYNSKIEFLETFTQEVLRDKESVNNDLDRLQSFLTDYVKINGSIKITINVRLAFIQSLLVSSGFVNKKANFISAAYFNNEFDKAVHDEAVDGKGFAIAIANSLLHGKALSECLEDTSIDLADANWTSIAIHVDTVAKSLGWDGHYDDEPQIALGKRNSKLFINMHNCCHLLPQTGTREDTAVALGVMMASLIEKFLERNLDYSGKNGLLAISGILNKDYSSKNQQYVEEFNDLTSAASASVAGLIEYRAIAMNDIEFQMVSAFVISLLSGIRPDATVYSVLREILELEKNGVPVDEISMEFGILGYLVEFENWHNITFGGALPTGHSNDWDNINKQNQSSSQNNSQPQFASQPSQKKGGCYIATFVYGSYDCPEVWVLRRFRDSILKRNSLGRIFIALYYIISPRLICIFGQRKWFNQFWRKRLDRLVKLAHNKGISDEKYND